MSHDVEIVVIGAGIVGLAIGRELAVSGHDVLIVEKNGSFGEETSSRNSEVIHAGIYYRPGSLKSRLCLEGRNLLYEFCENYGVPCKRMGKLIVSTNRHEFEQLGDIVKLANANGVNDLTILDKNETLELEPELNATGSVLSPSSGVVDTHELMLALLGDAEVNGAAFAVSTDIETGSVQSDEGFKLKFGGANPTEITTKHVIVAAGHWSQAVTRKLGVREENIPSLHLVKGNYFSISRPGLFNRLIYPMPDSHGLGIHMTLDLAGKVKFGPDAEYLDSSNPSELNYEVDPTRAESFYDAIRKYWPGLKDGDLQPDYAGVRPKLSINSAQNIDFCIHGALEHGCRNLICLYGIESPGLTACLAIAREVNSRMFNSNSPLQSGGENSQ